MGATVSNVVEKIVPMLLLILSSAFVFMGTQSSWDKSGRLFVNMSLVAGTIVLYGWYCGAIQLLSAICNIISFRCFHRSMRMGFIYIYIYIIIIITIIVKKKTIYIYAFSRRFYPKRLTIAFRLYIFISMCVPWESNPQPFALLTQCSTTEPHRNTCIYKTNIKVPLLWVMKGSCFGYGSPQQQVDMHAR